MARTAWAFVMLNGATFDDPDDNRCRSAHLMNDPRRPRGRPCKMGHSESMSTLSRQIHLVTEHIAGNL